MSPDRMVQHARRIEDAGFFTGVCIAALFSIGEFLVYIGAVTPPGEREFPWMTVLFFIGCVAPKYLGRATMGAVWVTLAQGIVRVFARGKSDADAPMRISPDTREMRTTAGDEDECKKP